MNNATQNGESLESLLSVVNNFKSLVGSHFGTISSNPNRCKVEIEIANKV
jgi:hypothetical protein